MDPSKTKFPRLSSPAAGIKPHYDVVVVGSGYGGSIAACRAASAGKSVCLLEKGKEWSPGEFPETFLHAERDLHMHFGSHKFHSGKPYGLYEVYVGDHVSVLQGCGLGGGSLINANVALDAEPAVYQKPHWPVEFINDVETLMKTDRTHVVDMLKPTPYPDSYPQLAKIERMQEGFAVFDIEDLHKHFYKTPIYVTFEDKEKNHVGVPQPKCTACGNCCGGCNVGAKNTLNMNYIAEAKAYGAEIYTKIEVMSIARESNSNEWLVHYKRLVKGSFEVAEEIIGANHVILGAGALGSTKVLLRSKERGLNISHAIGTRLSTNGDMPAFSYDGAKETNSIGVKTKDLIGPNKKVAPGPSNTTVIDLRRRSGKKEAGFVIEDFTPPSSVGSVYSIVLTAAAKHGIDITCEAMDNSMTFLGMCRDGARGKVNYHSKTDDISISYEDVEDEPNFNVVNAAVRKVAEKLGGTFVENPSWSKYLGKSIITVHPLGGCRMAESGETGVVNHAGQVFKGDSKEVLEGLYVVDGAVIPTSVGVNPTLTISCVAERCMRLLAKREGWHINYNFKHLGENEFVQQKPGICFTEKMVGEFQENKNQDEKTSCEFTLTIESNDVEAMIKFDPDHTAEISGTVTCPALSSSPLSVSEGRFQLFSPAENDTKKSPSKQMIYKMILNDQSSTTTYSFDGVKHIHKNHFWNIGLHDTTVLFVKVYRGANFSGEIIGTAKLYITIPNFAKQLATMEITHTQSVREKAYWLSKFGKFFARTLWDVYGPGVRAHNIDYDDEDQPPRQKRSLKLKGCTPVVYEVMTKDEFQILVTRYQGGSKGPVVMFHGAGVSSEIFSLDSIDTNLLEYLLQFGYDVWLVDWRTSCNLPLMVEKRYTLDDCAAYDYPAAIDKVLEITKKKTVQIVAHCAGSLVLFASLLSGALEGKVRNVVASQVAANPIPAPFNSYKSSLRLPGFAHFIGLNGLTVDTSAHASFFGRIFNGFSGAVVNHLVLPRSERCQSRVCHRITFIYGLLWEHANLTELTHGTLHEFFGYVTTLVSAQLALTMRWQKLVSSSGEDIYLPDSDKGLKSPLYKEHINRLNFPIRFIVGEKNSCYLPESTLTTLNLVKEAHPHQNYSRITIPDYGHLDCIYGKDAVHDVFPHIKESLEQYAEDN
ncbi:uncharacterized protein LOC114518825 isoform X2 [Dendronephthya gigantea]|uniref:uncharacterized protein LOC114518825 isoform X2 n=1 Tax=Dendronephthya gigantea TaxID=151771 RepID=UPI00106C43DE|nr:uncharacterized protein LOC114518825 isoform X2 [Dendronephthya gigantea]XP_028394625.1 uncharacterized protein LOC114518825 isoform X2 [Dendronephthya gigantea]XP_028394626.1 uncharacterized protein LOC114518825 isoform X2 [Dendronephthya gigantea]